LVESTKLVLPCLDRAGHSSNKNISAPIEAGKD